MITFFVSVLSLLPLSVIPPLIAISFLLLIFASLLGVTVGCLAMALLTRAPRCLIQEIAYRSRAMWWTLSLWHVGLLLWHVGWVGLHTYGFLLRWFIWDPAVCVERMFCRTILLLAAVGRIGLHTYAVLFCWFVWSPAVRAGRMVY